MATLYPGSTNHKETMANLFWRNPSAGSEPAVSGNMIYVNFSSPLAGIRNQGSNSIDVSDFASSHLGENSFSSWRDRRNMMLFEGAHSGSLDDGDELIRSSATDDDPHMALQTQLSILNEHNLSFQKSMYGGQGQGLSLSLGMQIPVPSFKYHPAGSAVSVLNTNQSIPGDGEAYGNDNSRSRSLNSKYIKAAQQLLDEIVNLEKALKHKAEKTKSVNLSGISAWKDNHGGSRSDGKLSEYLEPSAELLPSEKPELQNKMRKLMVMLEEVNRRYKQYFNEMQIVDSSFDAIAGTGAAKSYTALALRAISRHFRCLRDAIDTQIRSSQKLLWEDDGSSGKGCVISHLRYADQHLRQQRIIQQLGVVPQHSWRPQRGLPENSVSILRAWLFEHFLHPYPNDSEKLMLARQAGLTRSQISNWFINARVRLWKPMIEHIYREEFGDNEMDSNSSSENEIKYIDELCNNAQDDQSPSIERCRNNHQSTQLNLISEPGTAARAPISQNKLADLRPHDSSFINPLLHDAVCHVNELERYTNGSGVSLALGLQHCDGSLPVSEAPSIGFGPSQLLKYFVA